MDTPASRPSLLSRTLVSGVSVLVLLAMAVQASAGVFEGLATGPERGQDRAGVRQIAEAIVRRLDRTVRRQDERPVRLTLTEPARRPHMPESLAPAHRGGPKVRGLPAHLLDLPPPARV